MSEYVALHTIGQTPRPDLAPFFQAALNTPNVTITGALDGLSPESIPSPDPGDYPLETRLNDGTRVEIASSFVEPLIQSHIDLLEMDVAMHIVLCAGPFPALHSKGLLVRPFEFAAEHFASQGMSSLLVIVPFAGQGPSSLNKWQSAGFEVEVRSMDERPEDRSADSWLIETAFATPSDALVLDYVGYPRAIVDSVSSSINIPVYDLGYLATEFGRDVLNEAKGLTDD